MKKILTTICFAVVLFLSSAFLIPKYAFQDNKNISAQKIECAKRDADIFFDHPVERILIQKLVVSGSDGDASIVDARAFFGIKFESLKVVCGKNVEVIR